MNTIPVVCETAIYEYLDIDTLIDLNKTARIVALDKIKQRQESTKIIYEFISKYRMDYLRILENEETLQSIVFKKYYPLRFRKSHMEMALWKVRHTETRRRMIQNIINEDGSIVDRYNRYVNIMTDDELNHIGW